MRKKNIYLAFCLLHGDHFCHLQLTACCCFLCTSSSCAYSCRLLPHPSTCSFWLIFSFLRRCIFSLHATSLACMVATSIQSPSAQPPAARPFPSFPCLPRSTQPLFFLLMHEFFSCSSLLVLLCACCWPPPPHSRAALCLVPPHMFTILATVYVCPPFFFSFPAPHVASSPLCVEHEQSFNSRSADPSSLESDALPVHHGSSLLHRLVSFCSALLSLLLLHIFFLDRSCPAPTLIPHQLLIFLCRRIIKFFVACKFPFGFLNSQQLFYKDTQNNIKWILV